jgi:hypothetical protein
MIYGASEIKNVLPMACTHSEVVSSFMNSKGATHLAVGARE